jgi:hypothetical protein
LLTDERPDGIPRRPDECKGTELHKVFLKLITEV